jgi:flagellar protein FliT
MSDEMVLSTYEGIARITAQMLAAARSGEWDALVQLERKCSALFSGLMSSEENRPRSVDFQRRKAGLIRRVLDDDAEIRLLVEPWLAQLSTLIGHTGKQRRLSEAYRTAE